MKVSSDINSQVRKLDSNTIKFDVGTVAAIHVYPVKGFSGVTLKSSQFNNLGFLHDRRWMVIDEKRRFLSQREIPEMARMKAKLGKTSLYIENSSGQGIRIPLGSGQPLDRTASVWGSSCRVVGYGPDVNGFLSDSLGRNCRLVGMADGFNRRIAPYYSVNPGDSVSFADGFPFLITTTASLDELRLRAGEPIPMDRFRANIVIRNDVAFDEDTWRILQIGAHRFHLVKPCARCVVTTIDQSTGEITKGEPLRTLAKFRTTVRAGRSKVLFGQNAIAEEATGKIEKGDQVVLLKTRRRPSFR